MSDQHQHGTRQQGLRPGPEGPEGAESAERLAATRDHFDRIFATADSIIDDMRAANNERFLEQARQDGGQ